MISNEKFEISRVIDANEQKISASQDFNSTTKLEKGYDDDYNPFEHRVIEKPNTTFDAFIHLVKSSLGTGILAMPNAFKSAGILFGSVMTLFVGIICTHCVWILVDSSHKITKISREPMLGFAETAERVFQYGPPWAKRWSTAAKNLVDYGLMLTYFTIFSVFIVFIANTTHDILNYTMGWTLNVRIYILVFMIPVLFIGQIRTLKLLVPFSGLANAFIVVTFGIVMYYIFREPLEWSGKPLVVSYTNWPFFFSTVIFAVNGIGIVMPLENSMRNPQKFLGFPSILLIAMVTITLMYLVMGLFGYVRYNEKILGSITLNIPTSEWTAIVGKIFIGLAVLFTIGLKFYIAMDIMLKKLEERIAKNRNILEILIRTVMMFLMGGLAIAVPDLGPFISFIGAVFHSFLGIFIPAAIETVLLSSYGGYGVLKWKLWKNIFLMLFAMVALFSGAFVSIKDIIKMYS